MKDDDEMRNAGLMEERIKELEDRVMKFSRMELPGQPREMHMDTSYLVQDLISTIRDLMRERALLKTAQSEQQT